MKKTSILIILIALYSNFANAVVPNWSVTPSAFTFSMNVTTKLNVNCVDLTQPNNMIGAFVGGNVVGVTTSSNVVNSNFLAFLTVYSNIVSGDTVTFKIYDATLDSVYDAVTQVLFQDGAAFGFPTTPFSVNTNNAPIDIALSNANADENAAHVFVGKLSSTDIDPLSTFTYSLVSGTGSTGNTSFMISNDSLYVNGTLDFETQQSYSIRLSTSDGSCTFEKVFAISVNDKNDLPTDILLSNNAVDENSLLGASIGNFSTIDPDVNDIHTYALVAGIGDANNGMLTLATNGTLTVNSALDHEVNDTLFIRVESTDQGNKTIQKAFFVLVNDLNEAPTNIILSTDTFMENLSLGTSIITFSTIDEDANDNHNYSFDNSITSDNGSFTLIGNQLRTNAAFDFETKTFYTIAITTQDLGGLSFSRQFILTVADSNDAPTDIAISNASVFEADPIGSFIGKFTTTDEDAIDSHSYTLVAGTGSADNASFTISNDTLLSNTTFNFNTKNKYFIRVQSTDVGNLSVQKTVEIFVKNSNDAPTDITMSNNKIAENLASGTFISELFTADPDSGDGHTYALVVGTGSVDNALFSLNGSQLLSNATFDFEVKDTFSIRLQTQDFAGLTFEKAFNIMITDVNDAPTDIVLSTDTINENVAINTTVITFTTIDQDTANVPTYSFDNSQTSDNASFVIVGNELRTNSLIDFETKNIYFVFITTNDGQGGSFTKQFLLHVRDLNDAPTAQVLSNNAVAENNTTMTYVGSFSTTDVDAGDSFTYSLVSGTGATDNASFAITGDSLKVIDVLNFETKNMYSILVRATDAGGLFVEQQYTINVTDVNDVPTALTIDNNVINENNAKQAVVGNFETTDEDINDVFTYSLISGIGDDNNNKFIIDASQLKLKKATNFETKNSYSVLVQTSDGNGGLTQQTFIISITDVNEAPILNAATFEISENAHVNDTVGVFTFSDEDFGDTHTFRVLNQNIFSIDANNILVLNQLLNYEITPSYTISVEIMDAGGLVDTAQFIINVLNVIEFDAALPVNKIMSPNADGKNDYFWIDNVSVYADYSLSIFNNAGKIIFETPSNYDNSWNGKYNNNFVDSGVYYYLLRNKTDQTKYFKGTISIIR